MLRAALLCALALHMQMLVHTVLCRAVPHPAPTPYLLLLLLLPLGTRRCWQALLLRLPGHHLTNHRHQLAEIVAAPLQRSRGGGVVAGGCLGCCGRLHVCGGAGDHRVLQLFSLQVAQGAGSQAQ